MGRGGGSDLGESGTECDSWKRARGGAGQEKKKKESSL